MKSISKEIRETKDYFINGYIITLVKLDDDIREKQCACACYMGKKGWALQQIIKMKRTIFPIQFKRTR